MKQLNVLYLVQQLLQDTLAAVGNSHHICLVDFNAPMPPQFEEVDVVIDHGGLMGTREMMNCAGSVKLWCVAGTGLDHVDLDYLKVKGIPAANCPGQFSSVSLAECAMMFILQLTRHYGQCRQDFLKGKLYQPVGNELVDLKLGIVGFGSSGVELARRARAFGLKIMAIDIREIDQEITNAIQPEFIGTPQDLDHVVKESDFLSLHLHLNSSTHHLMDARRIGLMKRSAYLINVARGALVDEQALYQALLEGRIAGAGLDVFSQEPQDASLPVFQLKNVAATPHIAGATDGTSRRRAACIAENLNRVAEGLEPLYRVA